MSDRSEKAQTELIQGKSSRFIRRYYVNDIVVLTLGEDELLTALQKRAEALGFNDSNIFLIHNLTGPGEYPETIRYALSNGYILPHEKFSIAYKHRYIETRIELGKWIHFRVPATGLLSHIFR